jgi:catechol O-methyltransferase
MVHYIKQHPTPSSTHIPHPTLQMDCFGSDSEEESSEPISRDDSCGVLSVHPHTETSLLNHVRNSLADFQLPGTRSGTTKTTKAEHVLKAVDEFCIQRHWMMHVGPEKGEIIARSLRESIDKKLSSSSQSNCTFVLVELGSYCGYSSILMAKECIAAYGVRIDLKLITLEIHPDYIAIARELVHLSGLDDIISLREVSFNGHATNMVEILQNELRNIFDKKSQTVPIDLLFIDHDKDSYKTDLIRLENSGLIRQGSRVVADNVVFAQIYNYLEYVQKRQQDGVAVTNTVFCNVEYSTKELSAGNNHSLSDGIGKYSSCPILSLVHSCFNSTTLILFM